MISVKLWFSRVFRMNKMVALTRNAKQVTGFNIKCNTGLKELTMNPFLVNVTIFFILKTRENQNFVEITLPHECSPVNLLHIFKTPFPKTSLVGCFWIYTIYVNLWSKYSTSRKSVLRTKVLKWQVFMLQQYHQFMGKIFTGASTQRCSYEKLFWKYAANLQANMPKCDFNKVAK